ncbi:DUF6334 family protein [Aestuariibacter sp. AA17]|uniref:DUF6334 family protein n=1 Tax=Fluctibacter corallii TaxID=2984329 RepID=A0ABT3ACS9_9ALTE|nr:DUF6334 family protein [Aestuariibacter sp. AA17]MCV2886481.1 DUF6334 family protein [Aestuariibacter sp. AA17]
MMEIIDKLVDSGAPLSKVVRLYDKELGDDNGAFELTFAGNVISLLAMEDDSISLIIGTLEELNDLSKQDVSRSNVWKSAIGKPLSWGWLLTNNRGYSDSIQLHFSDGIFDMGFTLQLLVECSSLKIRAVIDIE